MRPFSISTSQIVSSNPKPLYVYCPECGGFGDGDAEDFGETGRHPCFRCGMTGYVSKVDDYDRIEHEYNSYYEATKTDRIYYSNAISKKDEKIRKQEEEIHKLKNLLRLNGIEFEPKRDKNELPF